MKKPKRKTERPPTRRSKYIVRVTVHTPERWTKKDVRTFVQDAIDDWSATTRLTGATAKASTVDEQ